jgi:hypothetical protein
MNKKIFLTAALIAATVMGINAQVGINTDAPQTTLDIIGDTAHIHGKGFRLIDGNQSDGKVLICDDNGVGTWTHLNSCVNYTGAEAESFIAPNNITGAPGEGNWEVVPGATSFQRCGYFVTINVQFKYVGTILPAPEFTGNINDEIMGFITKPSLMPSINHTPLSTNFVSNLTDVANPMATRYNGFYFGSLINNSVMPNATAIYFQGFTENRDAFTSGQSIAQFFMTYQVE